jgi:hypothetical protein
MKISLSKNKVLESISRHTFSKKEYKRLSIFLLDRIKVSPGIDPTPSIEVRYTITRDERKVLEDSEGIETLKATIADLAIAHYRNRYPGKNVIAEEIPYPPFGKGTSDEFQIFAFRAYQPATLKLREKIDTLIEQVIKERYHLDKHIPRKDEKPKRNKEGKTYLQYYFDIFRELTANRFIDKDSGELIYPFREIEKWLKKRAKKEPHPIKCQWCKQRAYGFHPKQRYCYRPSCISSYSRKHGEKKKGTKSDTDK